MSSFRLISQILENSPPPVSQPPPLPISKPHHYSPFILLVLPLIPWFLVLVSYVSTLLFLSCVSVSLHAQQWKKFYLCSQLGGKLSRFTSFQMPFALGSQSLFIAAGYPPSSVLGLSQRLSSFSSILQQITHTPSDYLHQLPALSDTLAYAESELKNLYTEVPSPPKTFLSLGQEIVNARKLVNQINQITPDLDRLLSLKTKTTYLILLQDNTEIRPSGGFLDNFALLTVENGQPSNLEIFDTTAVDTFLRGQIDPPPSLKKAIGEASWYLRDANWDPDFSISAERLSWFVQKELSRPVDVVVAFNLSLFKPLLTITGPINLPEFGGQITSQNLVEQYLRFASIKPGSPKIMSSLVSALEPRLKALSSLQGQQLLSLMLEAFGSRQAFISPLTFSSPGLISNGWSGGLNPPACRSQFPCLLQFIYPVESNVGINKANAYVSRNTVLSLNFTSGQLQTVFRSQFTNASTEEAWPQGNYKNYFRFYLPTSAQIDTIKVNNRILEPSQYDLFFIKGKILLEFMINLAPRQTQALDIQFHQPLPQTPRFHYQLDLFNQPGLSPSPLSISVSFPSGWIVSSAQQPSVASSGSFRYNVLLDQPIRLDLDIAPGN